MFNFFRSRRSGMRKNRSLNYQLVNFDKAKEMIGDDRNIVIDVRTKREFDIMHIENAVNIPVEELKFRENEYRDKECIILYCSSGIRTKEAIGALNGLGYGNLYIWEYGSLSNFPFKEMIKM